MHLPNDRCGIAHRARHPKGAEQGSIDINGGSGRTGGPIRERIYTHILSSLSAHANPSFTPSVRSFKTDNQELRPVSKLLNLDYFQFMVEIIAVSSVNHQVVSSIASRGNNHAIPTQPRSCMTHALTWLMIQAFKLGLRNANGFKDARTTHIDHLFESNSQPIQLP